MSRFLTGKRFKELASVCLQRAENARSSDGSVDIEELCNGFGAEIIFRPLLCEGLIGRRKSGDKPWVVAVDSETFPKEALTDPTHRLSNRLRNTIAHELVHILSFRFEEFGVELPEALTGKSKKEIVQSLESETEGLSPLMLIPTSILNEFEDIHSVDGIVNFCNSRRFSVSLLIQRLNICSKIGERIDAPIFKNCVIGICRSNRFESWPLFCRTDSKLLPEFVHDILDKKIVQISNLFTEWKPENPLPSYLAEFYLGTKRSRHEALAIGRLFVSRKGKYPKLFYISIKTKN